MGRSCLPSRALAICTGSSSREPRFLHPSTFSPSSPTSSLFVHTSVRVVSLTYLKRILLASTTTSSSTCPITTLCYAYNGVQLFEPDSCFLKTWSSRDSCRTNCESVLLQQSSPSICKLELCICSATCIPTDETEDI